jgi:hypothetical protein
MFVTRTLLLVEACWQVIQDLPAYVAYSRLILSLSNHFEKVCDVKSPIRLVRLMGDLGTQTRSGVEQSVNFVGLRLVPLRLRWGIVCLAKMRNINFFTALGWIMLESNLLAHITGYCES